VRHVRRRYSAILAAAPRGTVADLAAKVQTLPGHVVYTTRQAACDIRKLRGKHLAVRQDRSRSYHVPPQAARTIAALLTLREHVIAPILAGIRSPRMGRSAGQSARSGHYRLDSALLRG
jgi:predicted transcriptional regulator